MRQELEDAARAWEATARGRRRLCALRAVCDTYIPSVRPPRGAGEMGGFWVRTASDLRTEYAAAGWISTRLAPVDRDGLLQLLDLLALTGFHRLPLAIRSRLVTAPPVGSELARGFRGLRELAFGMYYSVPSNGSNPNWPVLGYPGPPDVQPPAAAPRIAPYRPETDDVRLRADVCIVGSGSGGSVVAATLAEAGLEVVILEAGGHFEEHNYPADEAFAYNALYWRGGWKTIDDRTLILAAGATLGGGSVVNWTNCVQPPDRLRREWAEHGLKDVETAAFDEHLAAIRARITVNADCSQRNGPNERLVQGAEALGWDWTCADRNADAATYDFASSGAMGYGDRSGSKQSALVTFLADAAGAGATVLTNTSARRIRVAAGRTQGVEAVMRTGGAQTRVTVDAPTVVVAGGALETPALLLRSGLGGPAVGHHLHVHPTIGLSGIYAEPQDPWFGAPHTAIVKEFAALSEGYGFLIEGIPYGPGFTAAGLSPYGGRTHKVLMARSRHTATMIGLVRDRGSGRVTLDDAGEPFVSYPLDDPLDQLHQRAAFEAMAKVHEAAGARFIVDAVVGDLRLWRAGTSLRRFVDESCEVPFRLPDRLAGTAHQMGTARMGTDPQISVADPEGRLHDTTGVWIGDTSAFPTATGVNPMVTCMALARRTAHAILADVG